MIFPVTYFFDLFIEMMTPPKPCIVPLSSDHAADCARIHAAAFAQGWSEEEFDALAASPATIADAVVSGASRQLLGFVISRVAADEAEILSIAIDNSARQRGAAKALLPVHLARLAERGAKRLFLEVDAGNRPALALYARFEFQQVGKRKAYYRKPDGSAAQALIMKRALD